MKRPAEATLADAAIGVMIAAVVIGAVGIPIAQDALVTDTVQVTNETQSPNSPFTDNFDVLTLDEAVDGVVDNDRLTVFAKEQDTGTVEQLPDDNVTVFDDSTDRDLNVTSTLINSSDDRYNVTYDGKPDGFIGGTAGTIADFVIVGMALSLFVAAISLVS